MAEWEVDCCVRGYHVYQSIWAAVVGEHISCLRQPLNEWDRNTVALKKMVLWLACTYFKKYYEFTHYLLDEEEESSVLLQGQEDIHQI